MSLGITELQLTDVSTISIPTDAILILSLLIFFALLGYFFHNILDNQTNQFIAKVDDNSHIKLVEERLTDQLTLKSAIVHSKESEKLNIKKPNFFPPSKLFRIGSLAILAIGGSSLLRIQAIQDSYKGVNTTQVQIKTDNHATKSLITMAKIKSSNQSLTKIKKISYVEPFLTKNSSKRNNFYQDHERHSQDFFSF